MGSILDDTAIGYICVIGSILFFGSFGELLCNLVSIMALMRLEMYLVDYLTIFRRAIKTEKRSGNLIVNYIDIHNRS
jgi:hypothetical protein